MKAVALTVDEAYRTKEQQLALFEKEVEQFSQWMAGLKHPLQQGALTQPERVLLLTYLVQKNAGTLDKE